MKEPKIQKVAVLGAGVMGAQIAAHCINAGIETMLFDLPAKEGDPSALVRKALASLTKLKPSPLAIPSLSSAIQVGHYDDLKNLADCDLIIEAIAERLDWKEALYQRIAPFLSQDAIVVTNTSGLSLDHLKQALPAAKRAQFCGMHFFNPPRYMHLVELIPTSETQAELLDALETWLTSRLGKGVIRAKDTPNFIANRIGVFSLLATMHHADALGLSLDDVDALTGVLIGRPKSATFRTMDVVGLDTLQHVVATMQEQLHDDPWHASFTLPAWLCQLMEQGHLGQKSGQGIYRKKGSVIEIYDRQQQNYRPVNAQIDKDVLAVLREPDPALRMQKLQAINHPQAQFLLACFYDLFHYSAFHLSAIADTARDIDLAMRWGFAWQQGPFETWQAAGMAFITEQLQNHPHALAKAPVPEYLHGLDAFYREDGAFSAADHCFKARSCLPVYQRQFFPAAVPAEKRWQKKTLFENQGVQLWVLEDDVSVLQFKTKLNTIGQSVLDGVAAALTRVEDEGQGLIIYQEDGSYFSAGADLKGIASFIRAKQWTALETMVNDFQQLLMRIKYSSVPVVAAPRGKVLGGGCELLLHCRAAVAAFEIYPGLVELGVGVIPAGGGSKEMAQRAALKADGHDIMNFLRPYFEQIARAQVAGNALEAQNWGYLRAGDAWVMHDNEVLYAALAKVKALQAANDHPPLAIPFPVLGREGYATLRSGLENWLKGAFISQHDYLLAERLAFVLCGGDVNGGELVDETWMLNLERQVFTQLAMTAETQARIEYILETGKPLRN
jgi:3-hydroxyacyl-CoA dehydrogenase